MDIVQARTDTRSPGLNRAVKRVHWQNSFAHLKLDLNVDEWV